MRPWSKLEIWEALKRYVTTLADMSPHCTVYPNAEVVSFVEKNIARLKLPAAEEKRDAAEAQAGEPATSEPDELQQLEERIDRRYKAFARVVGKDVQDIRSALASVELRLDRLEASAEKEVVESKASEPDELQELHGRIDRLKQRAGFDRGRAYKSSHEADMKIARLETWADKLTEWSDKHHYALTRAPRFADDAR
ncbi:hypothetical protein LCGC14_1557760 [marine sediment metagenome]|uniref:Uncharacterized protein n=1 Tax=marine sediment metagenome TaxID=412755 RepID=A0A0F9ING2_9ZZZZ